MYSCYQTVGTCYPPAGLKKQGQVQAMWIGRKTKGPAHSALKIIVATILERRLWPKPLLTLVLFFFLVLFCCCALLCFFGAAAGSFPHLGMVLLTEITSNAAECVGL